MPRFVTTSGAIALGFAAFLTSACGPSAAELRAERLQHELDAANQQQHDLQGRFDSLSHENQQMADRLHALGVNVDALRNAQSQTQSELDTARANLEAAAARERQAQARLATFRNMLEGFRAMIQSGQLRVRIVRNRMVIELPEGILFDSGQAVLKDTGEQTLTQVATILHGISNRDFQVAGHTDNVPIHGHRFPSNWELSTARAVNVARYLITQGLDASRLSAAGYADTQPVASNDDDAGRAQNRRIEIAMMPNLDELPDLSSLESMESTPTPAPAAPDPAH